MGAEFLHHAHNCVSATSGRVNPEYVDMKMKKAVVAAIRHNATDIVMSNCAGVVLKMWINSHILVGQEPRNC